MRRLAIALFLSICAPAVAVAEDCLLCGQDSTDKCDGASQCRGTREHCKSIGCKISGTGSCSTAANVKICELGEAGPMMSTVVYQTVAR